MTERKRWPDFAENLRLDAIALLLDIEVLQVRLEEANKRGDRVEVARLNVAIAGKRNKAKGLLQEAKRL